MSSTNRSSGGAGTWPTYSTAPVWPTAGPTETSTMPTKNSVAPGGRPSGNGAGSMPAAARDPGWAVGNDVRVEYVSRTPGPPLDGLIGDLYYLEGAPPYSRLMLPAAPAPLLIVNLGAPFLIRAGTDVDAVEYADGCAVTTPTRAWEFGY